ncbi:MAG TPA: hypothetical protein VHB21_03405 [Minicystis sp.]|nr:hypothetical protein [Minicystis sp.]
MRRLSAARTLLLPVDVTVPAWLDFGGSRFRRKIEHHVTVFGTTAGRLLAAATDAALAERVDALAATFDFDVRPRDEYLWVVEPDGGGARLETIVAMVDARLDAFRAAVSAVLEGADETPDPAAARELVAWLRTPAAPHVTLYTTDPDGRRGIGLRDADELGEALARGAAFDATGLAARPIDARALPPPRWGAAR